MGSVITSIRAHSDGIVNSLASGSVRNKRRAEYYEDFDETPTKKKRLESTIRFVYQSCFIEGKGSDVTVTVLGRSWKLHKTYLQQSPYFASMFSGNWRESNSTEISLEIVDPKIDEESIHTVFGSCYCYEVQICPKKVIGVLAAATHFQLDGVIDACTEIMIEHLNASTFLEYYEAAVNYGVQKVMDEVVLWLCCNLTTYLYLNLEYLSLTPPSLMEKAMKSPDLCVVQSEVYLYLVLLVWMYSRVNPDWQFDADLNVSSRNFFRQFKRDEAPCFLDKPEGLGYVKCFKCLKIASLLQHSHDAFAIHEDNIIPSHALHKALWNHWFSFLEIFEGYDSGPSNVSDDYFTTHAVRLGKVIMSDITDTWKWASFNYGIELVWMVKRNVLYVQRVKGGIVGPSNNLNSTSLQKMMVRVVVFKLNENRQMQEKIVLERKVITLIKYREVALLDFNQCANPFPVYLSVQLLVSNPNLPPAPAS